MELIGASCVQHSSIRVKDVAAVAVDYFGLSVATILLCCVVLCCVVLCCVVLCSEYYRKASNGLCSNKVSGVAYYNLAVWRFYRLRHIGSYMCYPIRCAVDYSKERFFGMND